MAREYYSGLIEEFVGTSVEEVLGELADNNQFSLELIQKNAWKEEIGEKGDASLFEKQR